MRSNNGALRGAWPENLSHLFSALCLLLVLAGCAVKLVGDYDANIDNGLEQAYKETMTFINSMETKAASADPATREKGSFANSTDFYDGIRADLDTIKLRANQDPLNVRVAMLVAGISTTIISIRTQHQTNGLVMTFGGDGAEGWRRILDQQFGLPLKIMSARKKTNDAGKDPAS